MNKNFEIDSILNKKEVFNLINDKYMDKYLCDRMLIELFNSIEEIHRDVERGIFASTLEVDIVERYNISV